MVKLYLRISSLAFNILKTSNWGQPCKIKWYLPCKGESMANKRRTRERKIKTKGRPIFLEKYHLTNFLFQWVPIKVVREKWIGKVTLKQVLFEQILATGQH